MGDFSTRFGYTEPKVDLAEDEMPDSLRSGLWDISKLFFFEQIAEYDFIGKITGYAPQFDDITHRIWFHFFRVSTDERTTNPRNALFSLRSYFFEKKFHEVYSLVEFLASASNNSNSSEQFVELCNRVLERERSAFRFADTQLVKISNSTELTEVENSLRQDSAVGVREHISRAASLYSQRPNPDYRNSIKESISAVESAVSFALGKKTYGVSAPLKEIATQFGMHKALSEGFNKLYAYTSDENGIRHALMKEDKITQDDARYMLVSCSAFANYLVALKVRNQD